MPLILKDLTKRYGERTVLDQVSLTAAPGEVTMILGASGAGKSTLLRLVAGLEKPSDGAVFSGDTCLSSQRTVVPPEARQIGLVFQDFALFPNMRVTENVRFGMRGITRHDAEAIIAKWLKTLGIAHRADAYPHHLSGGEQQRVAIARALAANPSTIMMDEPFSGLDPANRDTVRSAALEAVREANIPTLMVTHDASEALAYGDQIAVLDQGQLLQAGTPDEVFLKPENLTVAKAFGALDEAPTDTLATLWPGLFAGQEGASYYRPEAFIVSDVSDAVKMQVQAVRRTGSTLDLTLKHESGLVLKSRSVPALRPETDTILPIMINTDLVYAF
ncbi:MAG: ABC transporter ATP-binding protein [Pseudomonadota bacterium]